MKAKSGKAQSTEQNSEKDSAIQCDRELGRKEDEEDARGVRSDIV